MPRQASDLPSTSMGSEASGSAEPEAGFTYRLCCLLRYGPTLAREAFCRSQADWQVRKACYSHVNDKPVEWQNWCYDTFYDE